MRSKEKNDFKADKVYSDWIGSLGKRTEARYRYGIMAYCQFTGRTCSELIKEAQDDFINHVAPWEVRHIKRFEDFIIYLKKDFKGSNWTKIGYIQAVHSFYRYYKISTDVIEKAKIPAMATEKYLDLPVLKIEDIRKAVLSCGIDEKLTKALILTFLSSGQAQAEIQKLQGRHLTNLINGIAVVNMTRGKTNRRFTFFIGQEALTAIKEYKPHIAEDELIFTQITGKPLNDSYINMLFKRLGKKLGFDQSYFQPHRFRHYFKSALTGAMDSVFIEFFLGHKLPGVESHYFLGNQNRMMEQYLKNQDKLTVFTDSEVLQKQYDELKQKHDTQTEKLRTDFEELKRQMEILAAAYQNQ